jgi:hypothetical protein
MITFQEVVSEDLFVYSLFRDSFNAELQSHGLIHSFELPISTTITSLIRRMVTDMQDSPFHYQFASNDSHARFLSHEVLPLQLLSIVNRGVPRPNDHQIRLRRTGHGESQTIGNLAYNRMNYAIPALAIEGNHFVIHVGE